MSVENISTRDEARAETQRALKGEPAQESLDAARSTALRDPAWQQPASVPENITFNEFQDMLNDTLLMWLPRGRPLTPASWWLYVKQFAEREFNKAYDLEYPKKREPREESHGFLESGEQF